MQRPFSCYCTNCKAEDFDKCINKGFTKGNFTKHKLPSNEKHDNGEENDIEDDYEEDQEDIQVSSENHFHLEEDEEYADEIEIFQEKIELDDMKPGNYVIVKIPVAKTNKKAKILHRYFAAKITHVEDAEEIAIDYLEQDFDYHQKFRNSTKAKDMGQGTDLANIVMLLPDPNNIRGGVIFPRKIKLKT